MGRKELDMTEQISLSLSLYEGRQYLAKWLQMQYNLWNFHNWWNFLI